MEGNLAVLGCGRMGEVLVEALITSGAFEPGHIVATSRRAERREQLQVKHRITAIPSNREAADQADIVLIGVKPPDVPAILSEIARTITRRHLVISMAAGVKTSSIEARLPMAGPIVRSMPNVAARAGQAMTAITGSDRAGEVDLEKAEALFLSVGLVVRLPEDAFDAVTALSGSGPALFAFFAEAMIRAGSEFGLRREVAARLVSQTMLGTAALLRDGMTPGQVRQLVTSPGGTTAAALDRLEDDHVGQSLKDAIRSAIERARELGE